jgi:tetratricopeptide (TPR) repeat protein
MSDAYYNRAETYLKLGEYSRNAHDLEFALQDFAVAAKLDPDNKAIPLGEGLAYYFLKRYDEAIEKGSAAIRAQPSDWRTYNLVGLVHLAKEEYVLAGRVLDRLLRFNPDVVVVNINRALAYEGERAYEAALRHLKTTRELETTRADLDNIEAIEERIRKAMEEE